MTSPTDDSRSTSSANGAPEWGQYPSAPQQQGAAPSWAAGGGSSAPSAPFSAPQSAPQPAAGPSTGPSGYGTAPMSSSDDLGAKISRTFSWMADAFGRNWVAFIVPSLVYSIIPVIGGVILLFGMGLAGAVSAGASSSESGGAVFGVTMIVSMLVFMVAMFAVSALWMSGMANVAAMSARGEKASVAQGFVGARLLLPILLTLVLGMVSWIIPVIGPIAVAVLTTFVLPLVALEGLSTGEAFSRSASLVIANLGLVILVTLIVTIAMSILAWLILPALASVIAGVLLQFGLYMVAVGRDREAPRLS
ncbi:hypothetical protein [Helcobacillus massiliensis]|uniref:Uncharacterized protein n=2 Tax=Helcobacillus massiliensis TaxID=521392 RepID=A0A839QU10_9MICO|nr:hypothetical protein [Helcobacillus massiliensis]MBB3023953.1 hypothetical protein [Helcobacillus massiliensis]